MSTGRFAVKNARPDRFRQEEDGQWWFYGRSGIRFRISPRTCERCGEEYVTYPRPSRFCSKICSRRWRLEHPDEIREPKTIGLRRERAPRWGGGYINQRGYVLVHKPDHPSLAGTMRKYVPEHRLVMEGKLGRLLSPTERVHHRNGIKTDNRPENLELWVHGHPAGQRIAEREPMIAVPLSVLLALLARFTVA
jgi:HNH endonuclease